jgi:protein TonB
MDYAYNNNFSAKKKVSGVGFTVLMHALLVCAVVYGLHISVAPRFNPPPATFITEDHKLVEKWSPPTSLIKPKPDTYVTPIITPPTVDITPDKKTITIPLGPPKLTGTDGRVGDGNNEVAAKLQSSPVITNLGACKPAYPRSSIIAEETGVVRVRFEIGADSRLVSATVLKSSGYGPLDQAAVNGLSQCKFKAAMQDGVPVQSSMVTDYVWSLGE